MFKLWSFDNFHLWCSAVTFPDVFPLNWAQVQVNPGVQSPQPIFVIAKNELVPSSRHLLCYSGYKSGYARTYPLCIVCENLWSKSSLFFNAASKTSSYLASVFILRGSELPLIGFKISPSSSVTFHQSNVDGCFLYGHRQWMLGRLWFKVFLEAKLTKFGLCLAVYFRRIKNGS